MRGTTVLVAALALVAAPAAAQEYTWTADRPDGVAPVGISFERTLPAGSLGVSYRFTRGEAAGLKFGNQALDPNEALDLYTFIPIERSSEAHAVGLAFGVTDRITVSATGGWVTKSRTVGNAEVVFSNEASGMTDVEVGALWQVYGSGAWRGFAQMGAVIPTGSIEEQGDFPTSGEYEGAAGAQLPYDMQIAGGTWAVTPGLGAQVMNEAGSVGGQVVGYFAVADNDRGWRPGNRVDGRIWAAHRFSDLLSGSTGVRLSASSAIQGVDPGLETLRDPGDLALSAATERVDIPLGFNLRMTEGPLAGHRLGFEMLWTVHEEVDGPQIASDWGFTVGWQKEFGLGGGSSSLASLWPF